MSKRWATREATEAAAVSPGLVNDELRAQQSSITTLDREQLPAAFVDPTRLKDYALQKVWVSNQYPAASGEQTAVADADVEGKAWIAATFQGYGGGWTDVASTPILDGFKGGSLFVEWSGNGYIFGAMSDGASEPLPRSPRYLRLRILVAGVVVVERRGPAYHEHFRIFGTGVFPPGDHALSLQWRISEPGQDDPMETTASPGNVMQAHLYANKYLAVGRFR